MGWNFVKLAFRRKMGEVEHPRVFFGRRDATPTIDSPLKSR
jgi:hypothetical protein